MKIFKVMAFLSFLLGAFGMSAETRDWAQLDVYAEQNAEVAKLPLEQRRVVFFGNSITWNWARFNPDFFTRNGFVGRGISGQSTYQFLVRFREDVVDLHPQVVVINAATNDVAENTHPYSEDRTFGNIRSMVELAQANGIKVVLTTTLPAAKFRWNPSIADAPQKIEALNKRLRQYAEANGIPFVNYYSAMEKDGALNPEYTADGVHPTLAGYAVMEKLILPVLEKL